MNEIAMLRNFIAGLLMLLIVGGCVGKNGESDKEKMPDFTLSCAAVLPAVQGADLDRTSAAEVADGAAALNQSLRKYFDGRKDVRMISVEEAGPRQSLVGAKAAAEKADCNAVLETTLYRYKERVGGEYTAKEPAAVSFSYRLLALPDGTALCRGSFDEVQEPLMNNLLKFRQSAENGFAWVTAERLLEQGLRERLDSCAFLLSQ